MTWIIFALRVYRLIDRLTDQSNGCSSWLAVYTDSLHVMLFSYPTTKLMLAPGLAVLAMS